MKKSFGCVQKHECMYIHTITHKVTITCRHRYTYLMHAFMHACMYTSIHACTIMFDLTWFDPWDRDHMYLCEHKQTNPQIHVCDCVHVCISTQTWWRIGPSRERQTQGSVHALRTLLGQGRRLESLLSRSFQKSLVLEVFVAQMLSNLSLEPSICILGCGNLTSESSMHLSSFCPSTCLSLF